MNRHLSRMILMQSLYEWDVREDEKLDEIIERNIGQYDAEVDLDFINSLKLGIQKDKDKIDALLMKAAPEWPIDQVAVIDKVILRISIYELLFGDQVPAKVAINEAVELAKSFGGENSSKFVNGVLGTLYRESDRYVAEDDVKDRATK
jgi:N utilization substance protein B